MFFNEFEPQTLRSPSIPCKNTHKKKETEKVKEKKKINEKIAGGGRYAFKTV